MSTAKKSRSQAQAKPAQSWRDLTMQQLCTMPRFVRLALILADLEEELHAVFDGYYEQTQQYKIGENPPELNYARIEKRMGPARSLKGVLDIDDVWMLNWHEADAIVYCAQRRVSIPTATSQNKTQIYRQNLTYAIQLLICRYEKHIKKQSQTLWELLFRYPLLLDDRMAAQVKVYNRAVWVVNWALDQYTEAFVNMRTGDGNVGKGEHVAKILIGETMTFIDRKQATSDVWGRFITKYWYRRSDKFVEPIPTVRHLRIVRRLSGLKALLAQELQLKNAPASLEWNRRPTVLMADDERQEAENHAIGKCFSEQFRHLISEHIAASTQGTTVMGYVEFLFMLIEPLLEEDEKLEIRHYRDAIEAHRLYKYS